MLSYELFLLICSLKFPCYIQTEDSLLLQRSRQCLRFFTVFDCLRFLKKRLLGRVGGRCKREGIWGYLYTYSWFSVLYSRNQHNMVKQLYSNKDVKKQKKTIDRNSLAVRWLGLSTFTAKGLGLILGQGTKILEAIWCGQKTKKARKTVKKKF